ncbi:hypothetical protein FE257_005866 [Aspergillus nanangensis]|uniref:3-methylaspartate ammonia-lyase n=1 Tax=Aspergillus nanangensis TaxID=2582783 RepID=A0AAD4CPV0_ASPNN|nr:hypothetical protein FE257_005866 [Aspergillus nanangensis]
MGSTGEKELKIFTPIGMIGYGFPEEIFFSTLADGVDGIIADCGSTDSGPQKLALGQTTVTPEAYERDLDLLLAGCHTYRVPIILSSAGGDGANDHVDLFVDILEKLIQQKKYRSMKIVKIYSEVDKEVVRSNLDTIQPCGKAVPPLSPAHVDEASRIVAQIGHEPFVQAMHDHPDFDIIVGGRAYDPAPYAAFCVYHGLPDLGIAYHMGKIMECGALCSTPKSPSALATVRHDSFDITPLDTASRCTKVSVAAHTLYEKTRPDILVGPGGSLHLENATYEELPDGRSVRVRQGKFVQADTYNVKLEGTRTVGYRSVFFGGFRDPILIGQLDTFLKGVESFVRGKVPGEYTLSFHQYGNNAIMGSLECQPRNPTEIGLCGEVLATTQALATQVSNLARIACIHGPYPHQLATAGNFAMSFPPFDIPMGQACEFCIYHLLKDVDPVALFPITSQVIQGDGTFQSKFRDPNLVKGPSRLASFEQALRQMSVSGITRSAFLKPEPAVGHCYLGDVASVIRIKNAGPYELTMDVMFDNEDMFQKVKASGVLSAQAIIDMYQIPGDHLIACLFWDQALSFKATIKRPVVSGSFGDSDIHGSQQHAPLIFIQLPFPRELVDSASA